jgi:hypothetical protein
LVASPLNQLAPLKPAKAERQGQEETMAQATNFFGKIDRDFKDNVTSEFPAWYFETHIENMKEERATLIRRLERGEVPPDNVPYAKQDAAAIKDRIDEIEKSRPDIRDNERTDLQKLHKELSRKIADSMFTRSEMMMGTASAHEEAKRMTQQIIPLSVKLMGLAKSCNVTPVKSKVSRNEASKIWKILGRLIGEGTNVEGLRRDKATVTTSVIA